MSTRLLRKAWWVDFRHDGYRIRRRSPENSRAGAAHYEALLRQRLARGEPLEGPPPVAPTAPRYERFAWDWFSTYVQTHNRPSEQKAKRVTLRAHLIPHFGKTRVDGITVLAIEEYKAQKLKSGLSPKSINNHLTILHRSLQSAHEWYATPLPVIRRLKVPPQRFDFLTDEESRRLVTSIADPFWRTMLLVGLRTGLRYGELIGLQWTDVDLQRTTLTVRRSIVRGVIGPPKNNRDRLVPLTPQVCDALAALRRVNLFVFGRTNGRPLHHETPRLVLKRFCRAAGLRPIGWHTLRHTFASQLVAKGATMREVQELLGHADVRTTMRYTHLAPTALREAVLRLDTTADHRPLDQILGQPVGNALFPSLVSNEKRPA